MTAWSLGFTSNKWWKVWSQIISRSFQSWTIPLPNRVGQCQDASSSLGGSTHIHAT
ncbi:hypothetical protein CEXT_739551, partial [Caerostris extrusa]